MLRRLLIVPVVILAWLVATAATPAETTAANIAAAILIAAPFVLPLIEKYIPLDGTRMHILSYAIAIVVAVVAGLVSGLFKVSDLSTLPGILAIGTTLFGLVQLVFGILKNSGRFAKLVK